MPATGWQTPAPIRPIHPAKERDMAKDPVCGMQLVETSAPARSEYKGKTYYFCSGACKAAFGKNPEKYASK